MTITANNQSTNEEYINPGPYQNAKIKGSDRIPIAHLFSKAPSAEFFNPAPGIVSP